jgi:hypothetical protein
MGRKPDDIIRHSVLAIAPLASGAGYCIMPVSRTLHYAHAMNYGDFAGVHWQNSHRWNLVLFQAPHSICRTLETGIHRKSL